MKLAGALLMLMGVVLALFAFMMDTTVSSSGTFIGGSYIGGGSTYNLGLLQQQMMIFQSGLAAFVAGAFLYGSAVRSTENAGLSDAIPMRRSWTDLQEDETEEERDLRVARVRRLNIIMVGLVAALIVAVVVAVNWPTSSPDAANIMNVDVNLTTNDMNVDENLTSTDLNAL